MKQTLNTNTKGFIQHSICRFWYRNDSNLSAGFTLVETLVAISILLLAVAAPLTLSSQGLTASRIARDQVTATYLIEEAIEYLHNIRDTSALNGSGWLSNMTSCLNQTCTVDIPQDVMTVCPGATPVCPVLRFNTATGLYGYGASWDATIFTRSVTVVPFANGNEAKITVTVSWRDGLVTRTISTNENILNWP